MIEVVSPFPSGLSMHDRLLRGALTSNAAFSLLSGIAFLFTSSSIAQLFRGVPSWLVLAIGIGLIGFSGSVAWEARRAVLDAKGIWGITLADAGWVVGSLIFLASPLADVRSAGGVGVIGIALVVGTFAALQVAGLRKTTAPSTESRSQ
ncbi:MAG: hypothetical protein Rubg2KO_37180 [Rubricoccaceae bacterium]